MSKEGRITPGCVGLYNNKQQRQLAKIVQEIGQYSSTKIGIQLVHTGRRASMCPPWDGVRALSRKEGGWQTVAPSSIPHLPGWPLPRELDQTGMIRIQDAQLRCRESGICKKLCDWINLHVPHPLSHVE